MGGVMMGVMSFERVEGIVSLHDNVTSTGKKSLWLLFRLFQS